MADDERGGTRLGTGHRVVVAPSAGARRAEHDHEPVVSLRGLLLVGVAVLLGALILPSATRGPLQPSASSSSPPPTAASAGTTAGGTGAGTSGQPSPSGVASTPSPAAPSGPAPSSVHVLVANGSTVNGLGASVSSGLTAKGYATLAPVVALTTLSSTEVWALTPTGNAAAAEVLSVLGLPTSALVGPQGGPAPVSSGSGADLVVVAGPDQASRFPPGSSAG